MKRFVSIFLSIATLFCFFVPYVQADESTDSAAVGHFYAPTVRSMIDKSLAIGGVDEEFFHYLADMYLLNPVQLAETISDLPENDILYLARAISYDLHKTNRVSLAVMPTECTAVATQSAAMMIYQQANNEENAALMSFYDFPNVPATAAINDQIASVSISCTAFSEEYSSINDAYTINFTFTLINPSTAAETYYVTVFKVHNGVTTSAGTVAVSVSAYSLRGSGSRTISFSDTGDYQIYCAVSKTASGVYLKESAKKTMSIVAGWKITVELTADRAELGTITLYDGLGNSICSSICLGKSQYNYPMNRTDGHTPIGVYRGIVYEASSNTYSYGPYQRIWIIGVSGYVTDECGHREELMIHGGDPSTNTTSTYYPLRSTNGCVRITNDFQATLITEITNLINNNHLSEGEVIITQDGQTNL